MYVTDISNSNTSTLAINYQAHAIHKAEINRPGDGDTHGWEPLSEWGSIYPKLYEQPSESIRSFISSGLNEKHSFFFWEEGFITVLSWKDGRPSRIAFQRARWQLSLGSWMFKLVYQNFLMNFVKLMKILQSSKCEKSLCLAVLGERTILFNFSVCLRLFQI